MWSATLDHHLVSEAPSPLYMGELPRRWDEVPARLIVNLCGVFPLGEPHGRVVHTFAMLDVLDPDLMPSRRELERFLDAVHAQVCEEPSYWHCHAGLNRSGLAVAAYLHRHRDVPISVAIQGLRARRTPLVLCNSLFERRLREWYGRQDEQDFVPQTLEDYLVYRR